MDKTKLKTLWSHYRVAQGHATESKRFYDQMVAETEAKLAEAEKPKFVKPKHLDYGTYVFGNCPPVEAVFIDMVSGIDDIALYCKETGDGASYASDALEEGGFTAIHGNLGDLTALSEPLTEFKLDATYISGHIEGERICLTDREEESSLSVPKVRELIVYLQRLIHTAERKKNDT